MASKDMQTKIAEQALQNPEVQRIAREQLQAQGQQAANQASEWYCASLVTYWDRLKTMQQIRPLNETFRCRQETPAAWGEQFAKWNIVYMQLNLLLFPIYMVFFLVAAVSSFAVWDLVMGPVRMLVFMIAQLFFSHMSYFFIVEQGGCFTSCGMSGCGYMTWMLMYAWLALSSLVFLELPGGGLLTDIIRYTYLITVLPALYLILCCYSLGGGVACMNCMTRCCNMIRGASAGARDVESGRGPLANSPPPPSANPANRLE